MRRLERRRFLPRSRKGSGKLLIRRVVDGQQLIQHLSHGVRRISQLWISLDKVLECLDECLVIARVLHGQHSELRQIIVTQVVDQLHHGRSLPARDRGEEDLLGA